MARVIRFGRVESRGGGRREEQTIKFKQSRRRGERSCLCHESENLKGKQRNSINKENGIGAESREGEVLISGNVIRNEKIGLLEQKSFNLLMFRRIMKTNE